MITSRGGIDPAGFMLNLGQYQATKITFKVVEIRALVQVRRRDVVDHRWKELQIAELKKRRKQEEVRV